VMKHRCNSSETPFSASWGWGSVGQYVPKELVRKATL
jgi:hypothetical protein